MRRMNILLTFCINFLLFIPYYCTATINNGYFISLQTFENAIPEKTIYVSCNTPEGGDGSLEHPFKYIQQGVDAAIPGDTVYVFQGNYVYQGIINKSINVFGENKYATVIYCYDQFEIFTILSEHVHISGFTLINSGIFTLPKIRVLANSCIIDDMMMVPSSDTVSFSLGDILLLHSNNSILRDINFNPPPSWAQLGPAIRLEHSCSTTIENNTMNLYISGLAIVNESNGNLISNNSFNSHCGIVQSKNNILRRNSLFILILNSSLATTITDNNFSKFTLKERFASGPQLQFRDSEFNLDHNYWGRQRILPKIFFGIKTVNKITWPTIVIDWNPAEEPLT